MNDSVDKIIKYFAAMTEQEFTYKGKTISSKLLQVSPLILRDFSCPPHCGACCPIFTLDYLPMEQRPETAKERTVKFNTGVTIFSDLQEENKGTHCGFIRQEDGRCSIYQQRPFSCDFELIRLLQYEDHFRLTQQPFGRGWNLTKVDGTKGALCQLYDGPSGVKEVIRKLRRLEQWMQYFGLEQNRIEKIINAIPFLNKGRTITFSVDKGEGYFYGR